MIERQHPDSPRELRLRKTQTTPHSTVGNVNALLGFSGIAGQRTDGADVTMGRTIGGVPGHVLETAHANGCQGRRTPPSLPIGATPLAFAADMDGWRESELRRRANQLSSFSNVLDARM